MSAGRYIVNSSSSHSRNFFFEKERSKMTSRSGLGSSRREEASPRSEDISVEVQHEANRNSEAQNAEKTNPVYFEFERGNIDSSRKNKWCNWDRCTFVLLAAFVITWVLLIALFFWTHPFWGHKLNDRIDVYFERKWHKCHIIHPSSSNDSWIKLYPGNIKFIHGNLVNCSDATPIPDS